MQILRLRISCFIALHREGNPIYKDVVSLIPNRKAVDWIESTWWINVLQTNAPDQASPKHGVIINLFHAPAPAPESAHQNLIPDASGGWWFESKDSVAWVNGFSSRAKNETLKHSMSW